MLQIFQFFFQKQVIVAPWNVIWFRIWRFEFKSWQGRKYLYSLSPLLGQNSYCCDGPNMLYVGGVLEKLIIFILQLFQCFRTEGQQRILFFSAFWCFGKKLSDSAFGVVFFTKNLAVPLKSHKKVNPLPSCMTLFTNGP